MSELRVQSGLFKGGGDLTNLDYIVQRCALFVLAKHVETVTARMIETHKFHYLPEINLST